MQDTLLMHAACYWGAREEVLMVGPYAAYSTPDPFSSILCQSQGICLAP